MGGFTAGAVNGTQRIAGQAQTYNSIRQRSAGRRSRERPVEEYSQWSVGSSVRRQVLVR